MFQHNQSTIKNEVLTWNRDLTVEESRRRRRKRDKMAEFKFNCPQCNQKIEADESLRGQVAECPHCGKGIVVPRDNGKSQMLHLSSMKTVGHTPVATGMAINDQTIQVRCGDCGQIIEVKESLGGRVISCQNCLNKVIVPIQNNKGVAVASLYRNSIVADVRCPCCRVEYSIEQKEIGSFVTCQNCKKKFKIGTGVIIKARDKNQVGNLVDSSIIRLLKSTDSDIVAMLLRIFSWKPYSVICPQCNREYLKWGPKCVSRSTNSVFFCNNCGLFFYLNDGIQKYMGSYISQMDDIDEKLDPINHQLEVLSVHDNFQEQLACFENDWEISQNPIIYERLKFLIDGLRARLNSVNFEKIVNAQRSAAATNVAYGTTVGLRDPQSLNASINRGLVQFCAWLELKDSQKEKLAIYDTSTNLEEKVIQYELMMNYYYDLQEEFRGKQKEDARKQRLLARCQYSTKESLPQLIPSLPDDKEELLELKKKLLDRRKEIETLCYSKMNHEKDRISDKIGFMILGVGIILILFFVFVLASLSKMK